MTWKRRIAWRRVRPLIGGAILALVVWRLGTSPVVDGLRTIDAGALAAATAIAVVTTVCSAWRWRLVARGQGIGLPLGAAVAAYYRSQFLNTVLPGGVLGDLHRGVSHGREVDHIGRGLRAVAWERIAGQLVQLTLTLLVLLALPSPVRGWMPFVLIAGGGVVIGFVVVGRATSRPATSRWGSIVGAVRADVRDGLLARRAWPGIVLASLVVVAGHTATFLIAARTAGSTASPARLAPLALLILLAAAAPMNVGGWGPREGVAAWAFAAAGMGAAQGVSATVVFGVLVTVASLPGLGVIGAAWVRREVLGRARPVRGTAGVVHG